MTKKERKEKQEKVISLLKSVYALMEGDGTSMDERVYIWDDKKSPYKDPEDRDFDIKIELAPLVMDMVTADKDDGECTYGFFGLDVVGILNLLEPEPIPGVEGESSKYGWINTGPSGLDTGPHVTFSGLYRGLRTEIIFFFEPYPDADIGGHRYKDGSWSEK